MCIDWLCRVLHTKTSEKLKAAVSIPKHHNMYFLGGGMYFQKSPSDIHCYEYSTLYRGKRAKASSFPSMFFFLFLDTELFSTKCFFFQTGTISGMNCVCIYMQPICFLHQT